MVQDKRLYSEQDQQASRVEPLHPKLSRVLSRVKFRLSVLLPVLLLESDNTRWTQGGSTNNQNCQWICKQSESDRHSLDPDKSYSIYENKERGATGILNIIFNWHLISRYVGSCQTIFKECHEITKMMTIDICFKFLSSGFYGFLI